MGIEGTTRAAAPATRLRMLESRAAFEFGAIAAAAPWLRLIGRGDNHPVLVLPGFLAADPSTVPLRYILRGQGYWVHGWRLGSNLGPTAHVVEGLVQRLTQLYERHEAPVSLIGWSLGGIYARRLAREFPDHVRQVITLGSPFRIRPEDRSAASAMFERFRPMHLVRTEERDTGDEPEPLTVPTTAIYTKTDGVVRWWQCIEDVGPGRENIEVYGSHSGLGFNPAVIYAITDRLAQAPGEWRPFRPPCGAGRFYPTPAERYLPEEDLDLAADAV